MAGTKEYGLVNADVVTQHLIDTVTEISQWDVKPGSGDTLVHKWALNQIAKQLISCWAQIDRQ